MNKWGDCVLQVSLHFSKDEVNFFHHGNQSCSSSCCASSGTKIFDFRQFFMKSASRFSSKIFQKKAGLFCGHQHRDSCSNLVLISGSMRDLTGFHSRKNNKRAFLFKSFHFCMFLEKISKGLALNYMILPLPLNTT